jgi:hypothetical protein
MFNSLNSVKRLEKVGVSRDQAETHIQIMSELMESNLVTGEQFKDGMFLLKEEMSSLRTELKEEISSVRAELKEDIASLHAEVKGNASSLRAEFKEEMSIFRGELKDIHHKIEQLESRMTIKLGAMMSLSIGILVTILKLT